MGLTVGLGPASPESRDPPQFSFGVVGPIAFLVGTCNSGEISICFLVSSLGDENLPPPHYQMAHPLLF